MKENGDAAGIDETGTLVALMAVGCDAGRFDGRRQQRAGTLMAGGVTRWHFDGGRQL